MVLVEFGDSDEVGFRHVEERPLKDTLWPTRDEEAALEHGPCAEPSDVHSLDG